MSVDKRIQEIAEENKARDITHPVGAVYKARDEYWKICRHGTSNYRFTYDGITRSISSGFTSQRITRCQYMKAVFFGNKVKA